MQTLIISNWQKILATTITTIAINFTSNTTAAPLLRGAGDSFAETLYQRYSQEYERQTGEKFQYTTVGNAGSIRLFVDKIIDFGATSLIPTPIERNQMKDGVLMVPTGGGSIAIVYNLQNVITDVKLSRDKLAKIFTGQITNWQQINPRFPNKDIKVVVCSGSCSTSFILTKYLRKITQGKITASRQPNWEFKVYATFPQDSGIVGEVRRIDGAIGYVSTNIALKNNLSIASIENTNMRYVQPTLEETKKALASIKFNDDFTIENIDNFQDGYPLVSLTWLMVYQRYLRQDMLEANKKLLTWILTNGQAFNENLGYTKIPEDVTSKIIENVNYQLRVTTY
ncbi:MAG: phosphate ABC transporter substrate-binding protein PstS [Microcystis aeruginosa G13-07]|jgi:phosphate transport system substrate-binding protein|nr:phosphate ABC transporter substrate-binding protein PstS [Microcystis aeruginosa G13-11]NCS07138.1 phosphate ABC transporter substrate-binding protein PstS [Microcystis aeruginosa G13-07]